MIRNRILNIGRELGSKIEQVLFYVQWRFELFAAAVRRKSSLTPSQRLTNLELQPQPRGGDRLPRIAVYNPVNSLHRPTSSLPSACFLPIYRDRGHTIFYTADMRDSSFCARNRRCSLCFAWSSTFTRHLFAARQHTGIRPEI